MLYNITGRGIRNISFTPPPNGGAYTLPPISPTYPPSPPPVKMSRKGGTIPTLKYVGKKIFMEIFWKIEPLFIWDTGGVK
jgi:hypothetical protein